MTELSKKEEVATIIVAAGEGKRFGEAKQFAFLAGRPVIEWTVECFARNPEVTEIVLVLPDQSREREFKEKFPKIQAVVRGGRERQDSVACGLAAVSAGVEIILVHDGVRPLVSDGLISRVIEAARQEGAAVPALAIEDTVKEVGERRVRHTLDRERLFRIQTPQGFRRSLLEAALALAFKEGYYGSDDSSLVERMGERVVIVPGERKNLKITTPEDLKIAEVWLNESGNRV